MRRAWMIALAIATGGCSSTNEATPPPAACRCTTDAVDLACGESQCIDGVQTTCVDGALTAGESCSTADAGPDPDAEPTCNHRCTKLGVVSCASGYLRKCESDAEGCRVWGKAEACPSGFCSDATTCGTCGPACAKGATECTDGKLRTCDYDTYGCLVWGAADWCPERVCSSATSCGSCGPDCLAARTRRLSAGSSHVCMIKLDGSLKCWGLGLTTIDCSSTGNCGQAYPPFGTFKRVSAGQWSTCGIFESGAAACWGLSSNNRLAVPADAYRSIGASLYHGCAVRSAGDLACWGDIYTAPVPTGTDFLEVTAGEHHDCALHADGTISCWKITSITFPVGVSRTVAPSGKFTQLATSIRHNCALRADGSIACWGLGEKIDNCSTTGDCGQSIPPTTGTFKQVATGYYHSCALRTDGKATCWGSPVATAGTPVDLTFVELSAGRDFTCGITTDGGIACWGLGTSLGLASPSCESSPCTTPDKTQCVGYLDGTHKCVCDGGLAETGGKCVDATPCTPNPCTGAHRTVCTEVAYKAVCSCDAGWAEDSTGACRDATPCDPNPCTGANRTVCTASGFDYTCSCNSGYVDAGSKCVVPCSTGFHTDGDSLEPNECSAQATPLVATPAGTAPASVSADIGPLSTDVDFFRMPRLPSHVYWTLLGSDAQMCNGGWSASLVPSPSTLFKYIAQTSGTDLTFSCARQTGQVANPSYVLGAIDFDLSMGDYPADSGTPRVVGTNWMADKMDGPSDTDFFKFTATIPFTIKHHGQTVWLEVKVKNPSTGVTLSTLNTECLQKLAPGACVSVTGTGTASVEVVVSYGPEYAADYPSLTAYHLSW